MANRRRHPVSLLGSMCHGKAVGLSAEFSTASAFPIVPQYINIISQQPREW